MARVATIVSFENGELLVDESGVTFRFDDGTQNTSFKLATGDATELFSIALAALTIKTSNDDGGI